MAVDLWPVVNLAWQLACVETAAARFQFIEPERASDVRLPCAYKYG